MRGNIVPGVAFRLSDSERLRATRIGDEPSPKAADVMFEAGLTLAVALALALLVNLCLWAAGVPDPGGLIHVNS